MKTWFSAENILTVIGAVIAAIAYLLADHKIIGGSILGVTIILSIGFRWYYSKKIPIFEKVQKNAKILFIDDKDCQIVTNLKRNNFDVRKIDDVASPATDKDVQWANLIFVDYKDVGKKLFGKKEGLGLITELKRVHGDKKRYVIYSSVQDFDDLVDFPYIRKNATYSEFISLISSEMAAL